MPLNINREIPDVWTLVTTSNVEQISFQAHRWAIEVTATNGNSPPAEDAASYFFDKGEGAAGFNLAEMFPGVTGANQVWMRGKGAPASVSISHA